MAYLHSLPALLSMIALIPGALIVDMIGKKNATAFFMFIHKVFFLLMAAIPLLPEEMPRGFLFVVLVACMNLPGAIYTNGFNSSIGDLFEPSERSLAIGQRNKYGEFTRILITVASGIIMLFPKTDKGMILLYQIYFIIAFAVGLLEVYSYNRFVFPEVIRQKFGIKEFTDSIRNSTRFTMSDRRFKLFLLCSLFFYIGWHYGWPIFSIFTMKELGAKEGFIAYLSVAAAIASVIGASFWMKVSKHMPPSKAIIYATAGMGITPFLYIVFNTLETQVFCYIFSGFFIVGTTMNLLMMLLENTPSENRTTIMSIHATLVAISQTLIPILSVQMLSYINTQQALLITGILRLIGMCFLIVFYKIQRKMPSVK